MKMTDGMFLEEARKVRGNYPAIEYDEHIIDAALMRLVRDPTPFDIILSGQLTLDRGPAFGNLAAPWNGGPAAPDGACCYGNLGGVFFPKQTFG